MTTAASVKSSSGRVLAVAIASPVASINVSGGRSMAVINFPTASLDASSGRVVVTVRQMADILASSGRVLAVAIGHVANPSVRAWTFTLDGHDYYVLHLGELETLIYDTASEQWYNWGSDNLPHWRAYNGCNWLGGTGVGSPYGSNIVVGDYINGALYFLNPDEDTDDDATEGADVPRPFERIAQGQVLAKGYGRSPCYGVELLGSISQLTDATLTSITLEYSDDMGTSYVNAGTLNIEAGDLDGRAYWRSLGSIKAPGRLFRLTDYGSLRRIDSLDMDDGE